MRRSLERRPFVNCPLLRLSLSAAGVTGRIPVPNSITVSILRFHREDPGSIPGLGDFFEYLRRLSLKIKLTAVIAIQYTKSRSHERLIS